MPENPCQIWDCAGFKDTLAEASWKKYAACAKFLKQL